MDRSLDTNLHDWADLESEYDWTGILLGNGASLAIWDRFAYESLFEVAQSDSVARPLAESDALVFEFLGDTRSFERVLRALGTAATVNEALELDAAAPASTYERVRNALIDAVQWVHPRWDMVPKAVKKRVRDELLMYDWVYSTNYDLLVYWSIMATDNGDGFKDFFWSTPPVFDQLNTQVSGSVTKVLYLHGALHLEAQVDGTTSKRVYEPGFDLLRSFQDSDPGEAWPLFVSEGTSDDKLAAIRTSDYLSFALSTLQSHDEPMVVFGHSLGEEDHHLVRALSTSAVPTLAISMRHSGTADEIASMHAVNARFPETELLFFDSESHPLGDPALRVTQ
jgi:hypothetical protein